MSVPSHIGPIVRGFDATPSSGAQVDVELGAAFVKGLGAAR
jgi:hypothetical protein